MRGRVESPGEGITDALARRASGIDFATLPQAAVEAARDLVVDHLGVSLRGWALPWTEIVRETVLAEAAAPQATLYGGGRTSARNAALVNGTAGHALELDDTHDRSLSHPGAVVIPAALAVGEALAAEGPRVIAAIVAGYEVQCRLGMVLGQALIERGMHPTATLGVFGAAAAAGRLLALDGDGMRRAFGIAASMSSGLMQFSQDPAGTMVKRLYGGLPAERGVLAAQLAARGLTGPREAIEGRFGIARMLAGTPGPDAWPPIPDEAFEISRVSIKLYPCCKNFHALVEAALRCRERRPFTPADVARVDVYGPRAMVEHHLERRPRSTMAAQYSLPYVTAVALLDDPAAPELFEAGPRDRSDLLALADRVHAHVDPALQAAFPEHFAGAIRIGFADGSACEEQVQDSLGTPARPIDRAGIRAKFVAMTRHRMSAAAQRAVFAAIDGLDRTGPIAALLAAVTAGADA